MTILEHIRGPRDLEALTEAELDEPAEEPREFLAPAGRAEVPADVRLTPVDIAGAVAAVLARCGQADAPPSPEARTAGSTPDTPEIEERGG
ncbi:hypothetical protein [Streptomyces sp. WMMC940]|uniref:hypothetical protein n=1 Tax=Streptomyces sp. WMMC940 TaxID=3015153 RepID=UPI0022B74780|nr:hypothetical protein [Streptomyces sp. WMMC940]MCZ7456783.1 hypothetical protein [Streptomyces sp. WMMC940]